jgi:cyclopropane fatty-acyl-phospholipid synthase-like methyltransferase
MDRNRYSRIAHGDLSVWNPVSVSHLARYVQRLALPVGSTILDIGCGRGHLLQLILSQYQARGIGVDSSPFAITQAEQDLAAFVSAGRLKLVECAFDARDYEGVEFDLVVCLGSTHALGSYRRTLDTARRLLSANGRLLVGEGYWKRPPDAGYLAFLKMTADEHTTHDGNQTMGIDAGFELVTSSECRQQEWDAYEDQYARNVEEYVTAHSHDPDAAAMLECIRTWRGAYLRWGRETLGFGLYLFRRCK